MGLLAGLRIGTPALGAVLALTLAAARTLAQAPPNPSREMAVTFDDLPGVVAPGEGTEQLRALTEKLVGAIVSERIPAVGFVNEGKLAPNGLRDPERVALLARWVSANLELGNHTYSHLDLHRVPLERFEEDVVSGEELTTSLLSPRNRRLRYFRHPYLHTGRSLETRKSLNEFLAARGYRVAPVTLDNSDWIFARAYALAKQRGDRGAVQEVAEAYVPYMLAKIEYFERQSVRLFSREIRQILLVHANALNADYFSDLVARLRARGYAFCTLERALEDPAYGSADTYTGAGGITWLHRWALTSGGRHAILPGEPATPRLVMDAAGVSEE
ncbi:MAG TPA: polysaccharide deacetylase family protein [Thermoanaerobaculia bacterium]|nr:polysaccharide deacetylase family protein [Thermoanaerobaculia bacterium]